MTYSEEIKLVPSSEKVSGKRWINASPNNAPVAKLTKIKSIRDNLSRLKDTKKIPIKEMTLTSETLIKVQRYTIYAFTTLPALRQFVHTNTLLTFPSIFILTLCRLGLNRLFETLWAWLILEPTWADFPQIAHFLPIFISFLVKV